MSVSDQRMSQAKEAAIADTNFQSENVLSITVAAMPLP